jgi:catechol 2,3-dioxygenase-like lactoylglutathione lyase family enzyme
MKKLLIAFLLILHTGYLFAQLPSFYNQVDHVIWVVKDLQKVKSGWEQLGFKEIKDYGKVTVESSIESETSRALMATAALGGLRVIWLQPLKMKGLLARFNKTHGDAVYSMVHATNGQSDLMREVDRMRRKKVPVQQHLVIRYKNRLLEYVMFDTRREGKYGLALIPQVQVSEIFGIGNMGYNDYGLEFSQFAFAITDPDTVSGFWSRAGFPALVVEHPVVHDKMYKGKPADYDMKLGWQRFGDIPYEWCIPLKPPTVYEDFIATHGEGLQHLGFNVEDIDEVTAAFEAKGFNVVQSGSWGTKGQPGSGRFAYIGTGPIGGVLIELLWNYGQ